MKELLVYLKIKAKIKLQKIIKKDFIKNYPESDKIIKIEKIKKIFIRYKDLYHNKPAYSITFNNFPIGSYYYFYKYLYELAKKKFFFP